jgi:4-amino-4-deoxy-L-arabinose transferase-like glycosyltransferase
VRAPADRKADGRMRAPASRRRPIRSLPPSPAATDPAAGLWAVALYSVAGLTLLRLAFLRVSPLELDVAEATRWLWSRTFAFGYAGETPLPIWLISVAAGFCGPDGACTRAVSPLLQAGTAMLLGGAGLVLGGFRLGAWAMLTYATLPGVAIASMWLAPDSPLAFFWALALYAFLRLRQGGDIRWAVLGGLAIGLGTLCSVAMLLFPLGVALYLLPSRRGRPVIASRNLGLMVLLVLVVLLPHAMWRLDHGVLVPHVGPAMGLLSFLAWQVVILGPFALGLLAGLGFLRRHRATEAEKEVLTPDDRRLLICLSLPVLAVCLLAAVAAGPGPNALSYAPGVVTVAYLAVALLLAGLALQGTAFIWLKATVVAQGAIGLALYGLIWATPHWHGAPRSLAETVARLTGWQALGRAVTAELTRQMPPPTLLIDKRVPASLVLYYGEIPPGSYAPWQDDPQDLGGGTAPLQPGAEGPFLWVGPPGHEKEIAAHFSEVQSVGSVIIPLFTGELRRFELDRLAGFRGGQP